MIDFRYHVVSLVSVFLALAVGIALGAGPLKGPLGAKLSDQVQVLRQQQTTLNDLNGSLQAELRHRENFETELIPSLVAHRLTGRTVAVVTLPDSDTGSLKLLSSGLTGAGATITGRVDLSAAWVDPAQAPTRAKAVQAIQDAIGTSVVTTTPDATPDTVLATLLTRALVTSDPLLVAPARPLDSSAKTILQQLESAGLLNVNGDLTGRAATVVILAPGVQQATVSGASVSASPSAASGAANAIWPALAAALDSGSAGAVVLGPESSATAGGVIAAVRGAASSGRAVSTVDTGGTAMGVIDTVLALREQLAGGSGSYGFGDGAKAAVPPAAVTSQP